MRFGAPYRRCDGKVIYRRKADAMAAASKSFKRADANTRFYRAYGCIKCRGWHLTSKAKHGASA